jgi:hypothetical protein
MPRAHAYRVSMMIKKEANAAFHGGIFCGKTAEIRDFVAAFELARKMLREGQGPVSWGTGGTALDSDEEDRGDHQAVQAR